MEAGAEISESPTYQKLVWALSFRNNKAWERFAWGRGFNLDTRQTGKGRKGSPGGGTA